jgi:hypothetical protein
MLTDFRITELFSNSQQKIGWGQSQPQILKISN